MQTSLKLINHLLFSHICCDYSVLSNKKINLKKHHALRKCRLLPIHKHTIWNHWKSLNLLWNVCMHNFVCYKKIQIRLELNELEIKKLKMKFSSNFLSFIRLIWGLKRLFCSKQRQMLSQKGHNQMLLEVCVRFARIVIACTTTF